MRTETFVGNNKRDISNHQNWSWKPEYVTKVILNCRVFFHFMFVCLSFGLKGFLPCAGIDTFFKIDLAEATREERALSAKQLSPLSCQIQTEISAHRHSTDQKHIPIWLEGFRLTFWLWGGMCCCQIRGGWSPSWVAFALSPVMASGELPDSPGPWTSNRGCMCAQTTLHAKSSTLNL